MVDIACLSLYCVNITALSVRVLYFPFYVNAYRYFYDIYDILHLQRFFHGISLATLAGSLSSFIFHLLYVGKYKNY